MVRTYSYLRLAPVLTVFLLLTLAAVSSGCRHTRNSTGIAIPPSWNDLPGGGGNNNGTPVSITTFSVAKAGGGAIHAGDTLTVSVAFDGDIAPYALGYVFNDNCVDAASVPAMPRQIGASPDSFSVTVSPTAVPGDCTVDVGIADADGNTDIASTSFTVTSTGGGGGGGGNTNHDPTISVLGDDATCTVTVTVADVDGDDLSIGQSVPAALTALDPAQSIAGGNGSATFHYVATDVLAGGSGTITFTADDGNGGSASFGANLSCAGVTLEPDTLYALPARDTVPVNTPLTIIVATGDPDSAFKYMNGVRITVDSASGFDYVDDSFNVGDQGGAQDHADGIWAMMSGLIDSDFLLPPNSFYKVLDAGGGLSALDFNVTPLSGADIINGSGALFNFQATFTTPGTYEFGFQQTNLVDRTFYQEETQTQNFYWSDISNTHAGVRSSIMVTP
jgi:hypothetical protein